jgi:hypothetical protein
MKTQSVGSSKGKLMHGKGLILVKTCSSFVFFFGRAIYNIEVE